MPSKKTAAAKKKAAAAKRKAAAAKKVAAAKKKAAAAKKKASAAKKKAAAGRRRRAAPGGNAPPNIVGGPGLSDAQARKVHQELVRLSGSVDYTGLNFDAVIEAARDPASPLHGHFEWNVHKAAAAYWREQARRLVAAVRILIVTYEGYEAKVREVVNVQTSADYQTREYSGFVSRAAMKRRQETKRKYVDRALEELWQWTQRHGDIEELTRHRRAILRLPGVRRT